MNLLERTFSGIMAAAIIFTAMSVSALAETVPGVSATGDTSLSDSSGASSGSSSDGKPAAEPADPVIKSNLVVTGYKVTDTKGKTITRVKKNSAVNLEITLKNSGIKTSQISGSGDVDVSKLVDNFDGDGSPVVTITSSNQDPLAMTIKFSNVKYSGSGKTFKFMVGYKSLSVEYETKELTITECSSPKGDSNSNAAPILLISRGDDKQMIKPNQEADITIRIKNVSNTDVYDSIVSLTPSDSLYLVDGRNSFFLNDLQGKKSDTITVKVKATGDISSVTQTIGVDVKYNYDNGSAIVQGSTSDKVTISAASVGSDQPIPYIIVSNYTYGGSPVAANSNFKLSMDFANTSSATNIENIVVSMETGENFAIATSSNTFHYKNLAAGKTLTKELELQALPSAKPGAQTVELSFKYEYKDGNKRTTNTMSEKLSIPIYLPDRFELTQPKLPESVSAGQEVVLTIGYVNKSKVAVSNVEAVIEGEVNSPAKIQNLGNIEAGKSGNIGFAFTPAEAGKLSFLIKINYEDANSKLITREFPIQLSATEASPPVDDMGGEDMEQMNKKSPLPIILLVLALLGGVGGWFVIKKKKADKANMAPNLDFTWDNEEPQALEAPSTQEMSDENENIAESEETEV